MTKKEFLDELQFALQGEINQSQLNEQLGYYDNYIMEESRKGKSESQVIEQLGNPRLIAKTIIETTDKVYEKSSHEDMTDQKQKNNRGWSLFGTIYGKILIIFLVIVIFMLITRLVIYMLPVIILFICISCIAAIFRRRK